MIDTCRADPDVSVIVIFRNEERFLRQAVASVIEQDGPSWELLLVDDGSTDASPAIAHNLIAQRPERIRYLTHGRRGSLGMSASRNLGLTQARGRWLTFLDADDVWRSGKLRGQLDVLEAHPGIEVVVSPARWWWSWDARSGRSDWTQDLAAGLDGGVAQPPQLLERFLDDEWQSICDLMIGRPALDLVGGYEDAFGGMFEDQVFHAKVFSSLPAVVTTDCWYQYRQHPDACTARAHREGSHLRSRLAYLRWLDHYLADHHQQRAELRTHVRQLVRRQRRRHLQRAARAAGTGPASLARRLSAVRVGRS